MTDIKDWSNDANQVPTVGNTTPDYMPEGDTAVSQVNDWGREAQAAVRRFYESYFEWRDFGHTITYASNNSFTFDSGTNGGEYAIGQRVRITGDVLPVYATITDVTGNTVTVDEIIDPSIDSAAVGIDPSNDPIPASALSGTVTNDFQGTIKDGSNIEANVTGVTQAPGTVTAQLATTAFVQQEITASGPVAFETVRGPLPAHTNTLVLPHTLGVVPLMVEVRAICTAPIFGYDLDEIVLLNRHISDTDEGSGTKTGGSIISVTDTDVSFINDRYAMLRKDIFNTNAFEPTAANFDVQFILMVVA